MAPRPLLGTATSAKLQLRKRLGKMRRKRTIATSHPSKVPLITTWLYDCEREKHKAAANTTKSKCDTYFPPQYSFVVMTRLDLLQKEQKYYHC